MGISRILSIEINETKSSSGLLYLVLSAGYLVFSWYALGVLLIKTPEYLLGSSSLLVSFLPAFFCIAGILVAYESVQRISLFQKSDRQYIVALVSSIVLVAGVALLVSGTQLPNGFTPALASAGSLLIGYSLGACTLFALSYIAGSGRKVFASCVCASMVVGLLLFLLATLALAPAGAYVFFAATALMAQSFSVACIRKNSAAEQKYEQLGFKVAHSRMALNHRTSWYLILYGCVVGLKITSLLLVPSPNVQLVIQASVAGFIMGASASMVVLLKNPGNMLFNLGQRFAFPLLVAGLIPWEVLSSHLLFVSYFSAFAGCALFIAFGRDTHCFFSEKYGVAPLYPLVIGARYFVRGVFGGAIIFGLSTAAGSPFSSAITISLVLLVALSLVVAFVEEEPDRTKEPDKDTTTTGARQGHGHWKRSCLGIADEFSLTPRETDILMLLLRAYTTERIGSSLCISTHTAKTHIYHIYQKMGIGSKGELTDAFESRLQKTRREALSSKE